MSALLGETAAEPKSDVLKAISEKLEVINLQLAQKKTSRRKIFHWSFIAVCVLNAGAFAALFILNSPYLGWDYCDPETAVIGVGFHALEWLFVRAAPVAMLGAAAGAFLTRDKR